MTDRVKRRSKSTKPRNRVHSTASADLQVTLHLNQDGRIDLPRPKLLRNIATPASVP
jgi:hypothetical protein